ncbi:hypothetical protein DITRI_Ditri18aG0083900 [Diplodiscus trichospermus]
MIISMGPDLDPKDKSETMMDAVLCNNDNRSLPHESKDEFMLCASNCEDHNFGEETLYGVGQAKIPDGNEDMEINITECTNSGGDRFAVAECQDATENSSSFGGTVSRGENDSALSDAEVDSALCGGSPLGSEFDGLFLMRKRKLTDHWRRFIHPLMWRCKWLELHIKEFKSQASRYDREIAEYDQRKKVEYEKFTLEGLDVKSQPFPCQIQRKKIMKRRKRKRVEDAADLASYMSCHNIFSYYESKKSVVASAALDDDNGNLGTKTVNSNGDFGFNDGLSCLEFRGSDAWSEQILRKIDLVQSQARRLKARVDKVVNESPRKFSSINMLSSFVPCDALTVSSLGEVKPFPDMIEGTGQHLAGIPYENTENDILIHNQTAKEELHNFRSGLTQQAKEQQIPIKKSKTVSAILAPGNDQLPKNPSVQPNVKSSPTSMSKGPNNKRKRGKRKSGSLRWSRRSSG